jgi:hypothetical protein
MLIVLIAALCTAAVIAIVAITGGGEFDEAGAKALATAATLSLYSLIGLACTSLARRRPEVALLGNAGAVVAGIGLLITVVAIWAGFDSDDEAAWQAIGVSLVLSLAFAHVSVLLRRSPADDAGATALARVATVFLTVVLAGALMIEISADGEQIGGQALAVIAILWVLGTVLVPLLRVLEVAGQRR